MSWVQEEWKSGLPSNALAKIAEFEDNVEKLMKDKKCLQFQIDSLQAALNKAKVSEEDTKKEKLGVEKSIGDLISDLDEKTCQLEKVKSTVKEKDVTILNLTNEISNAKRERDFEKEERTKVERAFQRVQQQLFEKTTRLDSLNQQLKENKDIAPVLIEQHELTKKDLEACRKENCRLNEEMAKVKEERDLERNERSQLQERLENTERDDARYEMQNLAEDIKVKNQKIEELERELKQRKLLIETTRQERLQEKPSKHGYQNTEFGEDELASLRERILELEKENKASFATISDEKTRNSSAEKTYELERNVFREDLKTLQRKFAVTKKENDDISKQLKEEREMFIEAEAKMKEEVEIVKQDREKCKLEGQEEREQYIKAEMIMKNEIERLKDELERYRAKEGGQTFRAMGVEFGQGQIEDTVDALENQVDNLRRKNAKLVRQNSSLLDEISKEQEQRSDVEETMKGDIDAIHICLQAKIDNLEKGNTELAVKVREEKDARKSIQKQFEELSKELDQVNDVLSKEREQRMKIENDYEEMKRQEEYRIKFESIDSKDSHYEEKGSLSKLVKKRSERWNVEVYELKKRIDELEKLNRELSNNLDKKTNSVGSLRQGFECKLKEDLVKNSANRSILRETPERSGTSFSSTGYSNTPVKKFSSRRFDINLEMSTPEQQQAMLNDKDGLIQKLKKEMQAIRNDKVLNSKKYEMNLNVLENEVALMKQQIKEKEERIMCMSVKLDKQVDGTKTGRHCNALMSATVKDSGVEMQNTSITRRKLKSVDDLKELVNEFEKESSELQEIIDESKEAIFDLTKALQGSDEVFLVDSKNNSEIKNSFRINNRGDVDEMYGADVGKEKQRERVEVPSEKQSYILSRLSLSDIDVTAVLSKLRIAVSQLESRLDKVQAEKQQMEAKIDIIKGNDGKSRPREVALESKSSRSAVIEIARSRDATIIDGTIDDIAHEENQKQRDENVFKHGNRCRLLWQQLCDANASLSGYQREINRQKNIYHKHLAECQEKVEQAVGVEKSIAEVGTLAKQQYQKQEYVISNLEEKLVQEQRSSELLQTRIETSRSELEEAQRMNAELGEKSEENRSLLYKHHKSNEKKLDAIMCFMKDELMGQFKQMIDSDIKRIETMRVSPSSFKSATQFGHSRSTSRNTSFHSPEANIEAELAAKRSRGHRVRGIEEQAYRTAAHGYKTIDELEVMKSKMNGIQDNVKTLVGSIDQLQREKSKLQDERARLVERIHLREDEVRKAESRIEAERRKVKENDMEFRADMDAQRVELLDMQRQFGEICDTVKRKDIELLNKTKHIKLLAAEWKEAEEKLNNQLECLRNENKTLWCENGELRVELERSKSSVDDFVRKMRNAEEQLSDLYQKLSNLDNMFYECKQKSLYQ